MPLDKQTVSLNFAQGLGNKADPKQLQIGQMQTLENSVFTVGGMLKKRNGFQPLHALTDGSNKYLTTLNSNLTAIGTSVNAYALGTNTWVNKGSILPMSLSTLALVRNSINQTQCDSVVASNNYICTVYSEVNSGVYDYKYVIADATTGQNIVAPTLIVGTGTITGSPRVFIVGAYFVIGFTDNVGGTYHLKYVAITIATPTTVTAPQDIAASYIPASSVAWDGLTVAVSGLNRLYFAYNTTSGGQAVVAGYLTEAQVGTGAAPTHTASFATEIATMFTISADITLTLPILYFIYYDNAGKTTRIVSLNNDLTTNFGPSAWFTSGSLGLNNLASTAQSGVCTLVYEINNTYAYDSSLHSNFITKRTALQNGTLSTGTANIRSLGLASKAFLIDTTMYYLGTYSTNFTDFSLQSNVISSYQPTYFLVNATTSTSARPSIIARLAYQNGGGYVATGLPGVTVSNTSASICYLVKDLVSSANKNTNVTSGAQIAGVYSQTGVNLVKFNIDVEPVVTAEVSNSLNISGGILWQYDGYVPVEQNFLLYPENIEATFVAGATFTPTGTWAAGSNQIVVSSASGLAPGMTIRDTTGGHETYIPAGAYILSINGTTLTISANTTTLAAGDALSIQSNVKAKPDTMTNTDAYFYQVTYEWTDNQGYAHRSAPSIPISVTTNGSGTDGEIVVHVPTLRVTYKVDNPVKICIYRWSVAQQAYYQVTSVTYVVQNDTTIDAIQFIDTQPDENIIGNALLYTTGGILENTAPPATNVMTLFDNRLWTLSSEDANLLNFSKQVIQAVPVEMSDLLTYYVAPNIGTQGNTGPIRALAAMDDKLIVFKANAIYYINGAGPDNTGSNNQYSQPIFITSSVGCSFQNSVVLTPNGVQFKSDKGIWILKRDMTIDYIGANVENFNPETVLSAINVPETTQIRFTLTTNETLMYDYYYNQWGTFEGLDGISSCIYNGLHTYLNAAGTVMQEDPASYADGANPVLLGFTTAWISLAGLQGFERFYFAFLEGQYYSDFSLSTNIYYDYDLVTPDVYTILPDGTTVFETRLFPSKMKCETFQLRIQENQVGSTGRGLDLSGLSLIVGIKKGYRTQNASNSFGS